MKKYFQYSLFQIMILLFFPVFCLINKAYALPTDKQKPMHVVSNFAHWDGNANTTTLIGNVIITQGTTTVTADKLIIYSNKQNQIQQAIATGNLASYTTITDVTKPKLHAVAQTIQYYPQNGDVILIGEAHVQQGDNTVTAPRLDYNMTGQTVVAPETQNGRTTIVIQPQQISKTKKATNENTSTVNPE